MKKKLAAFIKATLLMVVLIVPQKTQACRLWAVVINDGFTFANCQKPAPPSFWFTNDELEALQAQGGSTGCYPYYNDDGWGLVLYRKGHLNKADVFRSSNQAFQDNDFTAAKNTIVSSDGNLALGHVRKASSGSGSGGCGDGPPPDPHPWIWNGADGKTYTFIHNGTLDKGGLRALLTDDWLHQKPPHTFKDGGCGSDWWDQTSDCGWNTVVDSELYFFWLMKNIEETGGNVLEGLHKALQQIESSTFSRGSKNFILSDGTDLYAYRSCPNNNHTHPLAYCAGTDEIHWGPNNKLVPQNYKAVMSTYSKLPTPASLQTWVDMDNGELVYLPSDGDVVSYPDFVDNALTIRAH